MNFSSILFILYCRLLRINFENFDLDLIHEIEIIMSILLHCNYTCITLSQTSNFKYINNYPSEVF